MSASYIRRDPLVSNPCSLPLLSPGSVSIPEHKNDSSPSTNRSYPERSLPSKHSPVVTYPQSGNQGLHSPKMSPDSTLTQLSTSSTSFVSYLSSNSTGLCLQSGNPATCDSFLRSALLSDGLEKQCVASSTNMIGPNFLHETPEPSPAVQPCSLLRPRAMTTSNASRSATPVSGTPTSNSSACASAPTSTTPIKKSSRRNPWGSETYSDLISVAIRSYPDKQATLQQIYDFIITHYDYFRDRSDPTSSAGWKNSIRHNLSLHDRFTKCPKSSDNTKSSYWRINPDVAAKPYVRRRACSMDTTNLKRPVSGNFGKLSNRGGGTGGSNAHRNVPNSMSAHLQVPSTDGSAGIGNHSSALKNSLVTGLSSQASTLSPVCEMQHPLDFNYSSKITCNRSDMNCIKDYSENHIFNRLNSSSCVENCNNSSKSLSFYPYSQQNHGNVGATTTTNNNNNSTNVIGESNNNINNNNCNNNTNNNNNNIPIRNGTLSWQNNKLFNHNNTAHLLYGANSTNLFNPVNFDGISNCTDQSPIRGRTSGLIEQLLRSDQSSLSGLNSHNSQQHQQHHHLAALHPFNRLTDTFTPNSFPSINSIKSLSLPTSNTTIANINSNLLHIDPRPDFLTNHLLNDNSSQLDLIGRQHPLHSSNLFGSNSNRNNNINNNTSAHHLLPVPVLPSSEQGSAIHDFSQSPWHNYRSSLLASSSNSITTTTTTATTTSGSSPSIYPLTSGFLSPAPISLQSLSNHLTPSMYENSDSLLHPNNTTTATATTITTTTTSNNNNNDSKLIPFLNASSSVSSISPSTSSSICSSSAGSWRHSLGLDMRLLTDSNNSSSSVRSDSVMTPLSTSSCPSRTGLDNGRTTNRPMGPITPPNLMYYPQTSLFGISDQNMDTSGYQSLKQIDSVENTNNDHKTICTSGSNYDINMDVQSVFSSNLTQSRPLDRSYRELRQFIEPYSTSYEDECEPLELELSLELADRIVGGTTSSSNTTDPIISSFGCPP